MYALTMDGTTLSLIVGQVITFILALVGFGVSLWREHRNRAWDLEDRRVAREALSKNFEATNNLIEENTKVSMDAFHEANDAKNLIASIEKERNKLQQVTVNLATDMKTGTESVVNAVESIQENTEKSANALTKLSEGPVPVIQSERRSKSK